MGLSSSNVIRMSIFAWLCNTVIHVVSQYFDVYVAKGKDYKSETYKNGFEDGNPLYTKEVTNILDGCYHVYLIVGTPLGYKLENCLNQRNILRHTYILYLILTLEVSMKGVRNLEMRGL